MIGMHLVTTIGKRININLFLFNCPTDGVSPWFVICREILQDAKLVTWTIQLKDKSPEVLFHGITSPYSYFEVIWIFAPIQLEAKHDQEKISAEQKWKVCWQSPAMFCLFTHQTKFQICCTVKLIPWNIVNLSHL